MKASVVRMMQTELKKAGHSPGKVDGGLGPDTYTAVNAALAGRQAELPAEWTGWTDKRKAVAYVQLLCKDRDIEVGDVDGYWGSQTEFASGELAELMATGNRPAPWRDVEPLDINPNSWPRQSGADLKSFYGEVGKNQVRVALPFPHRLAWDLRKTVNSFSCHEKVHDSLKRVLTRVHDHYGIDRIRELRLDHWGGCLNVRKMRGGTRYSMHSWGIAIDYDPTHNQLRWGRDRASFAHSDYDAWWQFWEEEGWVSLGRTKNYDWMHVQAAKL